MIIHGGFGMRHDSDFLDDTWAWDMRAENPSWINLNSGFTSQGRPSQRAAHAGTMIKGAKPGTCELLIFSGVRYTSQGQEYDNEVWSLQLDPALVRQHKSGRGSLGWRKLILPDQRPHPRTEHIFVSASSDSSCAYIHGGYYISNHNQVNAYINVFDAVWKVELNSLGEFIWTKISFPRLSTKPPARFTHSGAIMSDEDTGKEKMMIFGGRTTTSGTSWSLLNDVWVLQIDDKAWNKVKIERIKYERMYTSAVFWAKHMTVFGGYKIVKQGYGQYPYGYVYSDLLLVDVTNKDDPVLWQQEANADERSYGGDVRMCHTMVVDRDQAYIFGGRYVICLI